MKDAQRRLASLRNHFSLHAHSQGAIIAAAAQSRLGTIQAGDGLANLKYTGSLVDLVSYGGGANMFDYLDDPLFRSYRHHVNEKDMVATISGMIDPFQNGFRAFLNVLRGLNWYMGPLPLGPVKGVIASGSAWVLKNPHAQRVAKGVDPALKDAHMASHKVLKFHSHCPGVIPNFGEHNFVNGYLCHIGIDPSSLPLWFGGAFMELDGGDYCLLPSPNDPRGPYPDCQP